MAKSSAARNCRQRERRRNGMAIYNPACNAAVLDMLIIKGWITESQVFDKGAVDQALTNFLAEAATRCAHGSENER